MKLPVIELSAERFMVLTVLEDVTEEEIQAMPMGLKFRTSGRGENGPRLMFEVVNIADVPTDQWMPGQLPQGMVRPPTTRGPSQKWVKRYEVKFKPAGR